MVRMPRPAEQQRTTGSGRGHGIVLDHADQDADQIFFFFLKKKNFSAAVAAYRASLRTGGPLSERKLAGMFG